MCPDLLLIENAATAVMMTAMNGPINLKLAVSKKIKITSQRYSGL